MSNDTMVTVQGWLGSDPQTWGAGSSTVTKFRVACTPRRFHRATGEWSDAPTQWYGVNAWRGLGDNCQRSLHSGDPVIVHGRLSQRPYVTKAGVEAVALEIEAVTVGHDLSRGVASFTKTVGGHTRAAAEPVPPALDAPPSWGAPGATAEVVAEAGAETAGAESAA